MSYPPNTSAVEMPEDIARDGDLAEEQYRLETFTDFPSCCPVSAATLARAGFFYTGLRDRVKCFSCHMTVEGWQYGDSPIVKHRSISPWCKFVNGFYVRKDPVQNASFFPLQNSNPGRVENCLENPTFPQPAEHLTNIEADYMLRTRQVVDMSDMLYPKNHAMSSEEARLMTFQNWPAYSPLMPRELASAGLYYTGTEDQVACFCCGGILKNWEPGDQAWVEHKRHFPKCFFVLGRNFGNVANGYDGTELGSSCLNGPVFPKNPEMVQYEARLKTFETWKYAINKEQLAKAGFYRLGNEDDSAGCFYCGGGLNSWKSDDNPWEQHAKWFPGCNYVVEEKGQEFVNSIQLNHLPSDGTIEDTNEKPSLNKDDAILQNPLVQDALQMGFDVAEIKRIMVNKLQMTGENYKSVEVLVTDLVAVQGSHTQNKASESTPAKGDYSHTLLQNYIFNRFCYVCLLKFFKQQQRGITMQIEWCENVDRIVTQIECMTEGKIDENKTKEALNVFQSYKVIYRILMQIMCPHIECVHTYKVWKLHCSALKSSHNTPTHITRRCKPFLLLIMLGMKGKTYTINFKLKVVRTEKTSNRAAAREFEVGETSVRKEKKELENMNLCKCARHGSKAKWSKLENDLREWVLSRREQN